MDEMASLVVAQLLFLQSENNKKPVHMYINSPGQYILESLGFFVVIFSVFRRKCDCRISHLRHYAVSNRWNYCSIVIGVVIGLIELVQICPSTNIYLGQYCGGLTLASVNICAI